MSAASPVIIALDGSSHSDRTLGWGLEEARLRDADVVLAHAVPDPGDIVRLGWYPLLEDVRFAAVGREYLDDALREARARAPGLAVEPRLLQGSTVPRLLALALDAQLLVVGARGHGGHRALGSVSAHLAAHAPCPVAVVREPGAGAGPGAPVVVGVDGSAASVEAAGVAAREAALRGVPLVVVHARPTLFSPYLAGRTAPLLRPAGQVDTTHGSAERLAETLRRGDPRLQVSLDLRDGDPPGALADAGRHGQLLVVGSRGLGAFRGMLLGSVSSDVLRDAGGTVLVVHVRRPADARTAGAVGPGTPA